MRSHSTGTNRVRFECAECGQGFTQNSSLKQHMLIHSGELPFQCDICDRKFRRKTAIFVHMRRHSGAKPFSCKQCGSSFRNQRNLKVGKNLNLIKY